MFPPPNARTISMSITLILVENELFVQLLNQKFPIKWQPQNFASPSHSQSWEIAPIKACLGPDQTNKLLKDFKYILQCKMINILL